MEEDNYTSIAFPVLGTGKLAYPYFPVIKTMLNAVKAYGKEKPNTKIERVCFIVHDKDVYCQTVIIYLCFIYQRTEMRNQKERLFWTIILRVHIG
jgi:hypothetical protein